MKGSPFIKPYEAEMNEWETKLLTMQDIMDNWLKVWHSLHNVFYIDWPTSMLLTAVTATLQRNICRVGRRPMQRLGAP